MTVFTYERVTATGRKSGTCVVCGKRATRSHTFENTVNPFNRNADGTVRTRQEVRQRVEAMARVWESAPVVHQGCELGVSDE